jgi:hypothetical protein
MVEVVEGYPKFSLSNTSPPWMLLQVLQVSLMVEVVEIVEVKVLETLLLLVVR